MSNWSNKELAWLSVSISIAVMIMIGVFFAVSTHRQGDIQGQLDRIEVQVEDAVICTEGTVTFRNLLPQLDHLPLPAQMCIGDGQIEIKNPDGPQVVTFEETLTEFN